MDEIVEKHRSILPHVQLTERIIFLTWRLAFTLPRPLLDQLAIMRDALELLHASPDQIARSFTAYIIARWRSLTSILASLSCRASTSVKTVSRR